MFFAEYFSCSCLLNCPQYLSAVYEVINIKLLEKLRLNSWLVMYCDLTRVDSVFHTSHTHTSIIIIIIIVLSFIAEFSFWAPQMVTFHQMESIKQKAHSFKASQDVYQCDWSQGARVTVLCLLGWAVDFSLQEVVASQPCCPSRGCRPSPPLPPQLPWVESTTPACSLPSCRYVRAPTWGIWIF